MRKIFKIEVKNDYVVKGVQLEGVKKICRVEEAIKKAEVLGAEEIFLVDNTKSLFGLTPNFKMLNQAARFSRLPITFGGGIKTLEEALMAYSIGASRVYINTALANNHELAIKIAYKCGRQSVSGGIEYRTDSGIKSECYVESGREPIGKSVAERVAIEADYVGEFIITSITRDGTNSGPDLEILETINRKDIPIVICGGINHKTDAEKIQEKSLSEVNLSGFASSSSYLKQS